MVSYILIGLLTGLVIGAIAAWIIRGLKIEKNSISSGQYQVVVDELDGLKKQAGVLEFVRKAKEEVEGQLREKERELREAMTKSASAEEGRANASLRNGELLEEIATLKVSYEEKSTQVAEADRKIARLEESLKLKQDTREGS